MFEKTERIEALSQWLAEKIAPDSIDTVKRAAKLAKTDLLTEIVNEFPSLQGKMGRAREVYRDAPSTTETDPNQERRAA